LTPDQRPFSEERLRHAVSANTGRLPNNGQSAFLPRPVIGLNANGTQKDDHRQPTLSQKYDASAVSLGSSVDNGTRGSCFSCVRHRFPCWSWALVHIATVSERRIFRRVALWGCVCTVGFGRGHFNLSSANMHQRNRQTVWSRLAILPGACECNQRLHHDVMIARSLLHLPYAAWFNG
jgi:hypothetical protein